jgi:hypothetical protein
MKLLTKLFILPAIALLGATAPASAVELTDEDVENLVRRSYQYVAMLQRKQQVRVHAGRLEHGGSRHRVEGPHDA